MIVGLIDFFSFNFRKWSRGNMVQIQ